jgi:hypothetical protein
MNSTLWPGFRHVRAARPDCAGLNALGLLARTAGLPGVFRLTVRPGGVVEMLGEVREGAAGGPAGAVEDGVVEGALEAAGAPFKRREPGWVVPAGGGRQVEVVVRPAEGGLRVEAVLAGWDEIGGVEREALAAFLCRAQAGLRFARCELGEKQALAAAGLAADDVEAVLPHALAAVLAAVRRTAREAGALLGRDFAEGYLRFFADAG